MPYDKRPFHVGEILPNGAQVIACLQRPDGEIIYLASNIGGCGPQYVTWRAPAFDSGATWAGHYFSYNDENNLEVYSKACKDFRRRVSRDL